MSVGFSLMGAGGAGAVGFPTKGELLDEKVSSGATSFWWFDQGYAVSAGIPDEIGDIDLLNNQEITAASGPVDGWGFSANLDDQFTYDQSGTNDIDLTGDFTFGFWVKLPSLTGIQTLLSVEGGSGDYIYMIFRADRSGLVFQVDSTSNSGACYSSPLTLTADTWHYIHIWRDYSSSAGSDIWGMCIDAGTAVTTTRSSFSATPGPTFSAGPLCVGHLLPGGSSTSMNGYIQHLTFWDGKTLSAGERTSDYQAELGDL